MLTRNDVIRAIAMCTAYDTQHAPRPDKLVIDAWLDHFTRYAPTLEPEDLLIAVTQFHAEPHERMVQPADLSRIALAIRADRFARSDLDDEKRLAYEALCDSKAGFPVSGVDDAEGGQPVELSSTERLARRKAHQERMARLADKIRDEDPKAAEILARMVDNPLRVKCPWCGAEPGSRCHIPGSTQPLRKSRAHPSREDALKAAPQTVDPEAAEYAGVATFVDVAAQKMEQLEEQH